MQDLNDKIIGGGAAGQLTAAEWNEVPTEIQNIIAAVGLTLSAGDLNQLGKGIAAYAGAGHFYTETGAANAYVAGVIGGKQGPPFLNVAADGLLVRFRAANANSGASTVNVSGLGAKTITREDGVALVTGDIVTGKDVILRYRQSTDTFLLLQAALPAEATAIAPRGYIDGVILSNDAGDVTNDISFAAGVCRDSTDSATIRRTTAIIKQADAVWAAGSAAGGRASGATARAAGVWYHCFLIRNPSSGAVDAGFDSSLTAANLLADATGFTQFRRVGSILTIAGPANKLFHQSDAEFLWLDPVEDFDGAGSGAGAAEVLESVPPGVRVWAIINAYMSANPGQWNLHAMDTNSTASSNDPPNLTLRCNGGDMATNGFGPLILRTDASQQIRQRGDGTPNRIATRGWIDARGRNA